MSKKQDDTNYRVNQLERKVAGLQRQVGVLHARYEATATKHDKRIRDVEIKTAVVQGVPQKRVAEIYDLTPGRISQIVKRVA